MGTKYSQRKVTKITYRRRRSSSSQKRAKLTKHITWPIPSIVITPPSILRTILRYDISCGIMFFKNTRWSYHNGES